MSVTSGVPSANRTWSFVIPGLSCCTMSWVRALPCWISIRYGLMPRTLVDDAHPATASRASAISSNRQSTSELRKEDPSREKSGAYIMITDHTPVSRRSPVCRVHSMSSAQSLKDIGLKATLPRRKILELFEHSKVRHLSAEDVYRTLIGDGIDVGLATVYRVLTQFEQAGLLSRQYFETGKAVFELNQGGHHDHLVCLA